MYLGKPSPEATWRADNVSTEQASLEGEAEKLQFNSMFAIIGCVWQYRKIVLQEKTGTFKQK